MLELEGPFTLVEVLQLLGMKGGSYVVEAAGGVLHVRDERVVWFSGGGPEECVEFIARYSGNIRVKASPVEEKFSLPIEEAVLKAIFKAPEEPRKKLNDAFAVLEGEFGGEAWFALAEGGQLRELSRSADKEEAKRALRLCELAEKLAQALSEEVRAVVISGKERVMKVLKLRKGVLVGCCRASVGLPALSEALGRLASAL